MNQPDLGEILGVLISITVGIIIFVAILNISIKINFIKKIMHRKFLLENKIKQCTECDKYSSSDAERCRCGNKEFKELPFNEKIISL